MFHVGQLVVCVDEDPASHAKPGWSYVGDLDGLTRGSVYTIRDVLVDPVQRGNSVRLVEIVRSVYRGREVPYAVERFRPVDETKLSVFKAMLVSPPKETVTIGMNREGK